MRNLNLYRHLFAPSLTLLILTVTPFLRAETQSIKQPIYEAHGEIPFGGKGGWDDLSSDPKNHLLFLSHGDRVVVANVEKNKVIEEITETPGVHGIALALDLKKAFSSNGKEGKVSVIDLENLTTKTKISVGENPDSIVYDSATQEVYAFNGRSHSVSVIDGKLEKVIATISLPGKPEFAAVDSEAHRIFVNIEDKNLVISLDTQSHKIAASWKLEGCESPTGIALDKKNHRLFSACDNEKMIMLDSQTGRKLASVPTGAGTDGAAFDPESMLVFSSNGKSGTVTIIHEDSPDKISVLQTLKTQLGARTITLNTQNHRIYLPTADFLAAKKGEHAKPVDGTQKVLVYGPQ